MAWGEYPNLDEEEWVCWILQVTLVSLTCSMHTSHCKIQESLLLNICRPINEKLKLYVEKTANLFTPITAVSALAVTGETWRATELKFLLSLVQIYCSSVVT